MRFGQEDQVICVVRLARRIPIGEHHIQCKIGVRFNRRGGTAGLAGPLRLDFQAIRYEFAALNGDGTLHATVFEIQYARRLLLV